MCSPSPHSSYALDLVACDLCDISIWLPNKHLSLNMSEIETLLSLPFPQISSSPGLLISVNGTTISLGQKSELILPSLISHFSSSEILIYPKFDSFFHLHC